MKIYKDIKKALKARGISQKDIKDIFKKQEMIELKNKYEEVLNHLKLLKNNPFLQLLNPYNEKEWKKIKKTSLCKLIEGKNESN